MPWMLMKFVRNPLPRKLSDCDVTRARIRKLVFKMRTYSMGAKIGRRCPASCLAHERQSVDEEGEVYNRRYSGDPRYFCVIGLALPDGRMMEVVAHEAVHAAYCYEKRVRRNLFGTAAADYDEERIAYPAGRIAEAIAYHLKRNGLYDAHTHHPAHPDSVRRRVRLVQRRPG
jgi:hypothetical protein